MALERVEQIWIVPVTCQNCGAKHLVTVKKLRNPEEVLIGVKYEPSPIDQAMLAK